MKTGKLDIQTLLKQERVKRGLTLSQVGIAIDCSPSYIHRLEAGDRGTPSYKIVKDIINYFDLTDDELADYYVNVSQADRQKRQLSKYMSDMDTTNYDDVKHLVGEIKRYQALLQQDKEQ